MTRETKTAVNRLASRPTVSVVAKPLTGPVPNMNRMAAETMVVTCVSMMVTQALRKALVHRRRGRLSGANLFPDALEDQHVRVHAHADGQNDSGDAGQGERKRHPPARRARTMLERPKIPAG